MPAKGQTRPLAERFWEKVNKDGAVPSHCPELGPCWEWTGAKRSGRASLRPPPGGGSVVSAAVVSYEIHHGPVPHGKQVNHHCDNPGCVAPRHIYAGTVQDNALDSHRRGRAAYNLKGHEGDRHNGAKTHCPKGHRYDEVNTAVEKNGSLRDGRPRMARRCRTCRGY